MEGEDVPEISNRCDTVGRVSVILVSLLPAYIRDLTGLWYVCFTSVPYFFVRSDAAGRVNVISISFFSSRIRVGVHVGLSAATVMCVCIVWCMCITHEEFGFVFVG